MLKDEGYIEPRERSGYYVCEIHVIGEMKEQNQQLHMLPEIPEEIEDGRLQNAALSSFPYSLYFKTVRSVITEYGEELLYRSPNEGCAILRNSIASYLLRYRGLFAQPEQIIIGSGAEHLYGTVVRILGADKIYGIEDPSYHQIRKVYEGTGAVCEMLPMGEDAGSRASDYYLHGGKSEKETGTERTEISEDCHSLVCNRFYGSYSF